MRHRLTVFVVGIVASMMGGSASAKILEFEGELIVDFGTHLSATIPGAGVATVNGSAGGGHLHTISFDGGITGMAPIAVTDPLVTIAGLTELRMTATLGSGYLDDISIGSSLSGVLTVMGHVALCLAIDCEIPLNIEFQGTTRNGEVVGVGIGGVITLGGYVGIRVSVDHAPWTIHARTGWTFIDQTTGGGQQATKTIMQTGFRHGPSSNTSSTALKSGVVSLINPMVAHTEGIAGNSQHIALFSRLTVHFIPEPGMALLLGSGFAGLVVLGRARMRK